MITTRRIGILIAVLAYGCLQAFLAMTAPVYAPASAVPSAPAVHRQSALPSLSLPVAILFTTQQDRPDNTRTPRAAPTAPIPLRAVGNGPGQSAASASRHSAPLTVIGNPRAGQLAWHVECSRRFGFCANFPFIAKSEDTFEAHSNYTSATSITGFLFNYTGNLWVSDNDHGYCRAEFTAGCNPLGNFDAYYFVEVIQHSRYAADPWQAITAINEGVHNPVRITYHGNLACTFAKGIYGGAGMVVWHDGRVYYLKSGNGLLSPTNPAILRKFLSSLRF